jgi:hypothetical protein
MTPWRMRGIRCHHACCSRLSEGAARAQACRKSAAAYGGRRWRQCPAGPRAPASAFWQRGAPTRGCGTACACRSGPGHGSTAAWCGSPGPPPHALRARPQLSGTCVPPMRRGYVMPSTPHALCWLYQPSAADPHHKCCDRCPFHSKAAYALQAVSRPRAANMPTFCVGSASPKHHAVT